MILTFTVIRIGNIAHTGAILNTDLGELVMTKEQFEREKSYQLTMYIAKKLLKNGIITENEYRIIDTNCKQKYQPVFGDIFSQNSLIKLE